jgi:hypothetical protein
MAGWFRPGLGSSNLPAGAALPVEVDMRQPWLDLIGCMIYPEAMSITHLTAQQLHRAAEIREKIENLEKDFTDLLAVTGDARVTLRRRGRPAKSVVAPAPPAPKPKRKVSKAGRARLSAAAKACWAKFRATGKTPGRR